MGAEHIHRPSISPGKTILIANCVLMNNCIAADTTINLCFACRGELEVESKRLFSQCVTIFHSAGVVSDGYLYGCYLPGDIII